MIANDKGLRKVCRNYEQVENYYKAIADEENKWELHHRREIDENKSRQQLKDEGRYFDVAPEELIFLTEFDHKSLHSFGREYSEETRKKISAIHKGKVISEEARKKISESNRGKIVSEETRNKLSESHRGKTASEETRKKMSKSATGENNPMFGKHHTEEAKLKVSLANKGRKASEETRKKMSEAQIGENNPSFGKHWWNDGVINKLSKEQPGPDFVRGRIKFNK